MSHSLGRCSAFITQNVINILFFHCFPLYVFSTSFLLQCYSLQFHVPQANVLPSPPLSGGYPGIGVQFSPPGGMGLLANREDAMSSSLLVTSPPRHTLRHRPPGILPTHEDSAEDLDNLDDVSW